MKRVASGIALLLALLAFMPSAQAAQTAKTVGLTAGVVVAAKLGAAWRYITITNQSATANLACAEDNATPALGAAGSVDIPPKWTAVWTSSNVTWNNAFYCISDTASTPATVEAQ